MKGLFLTGKKFFLIGPSHRTKTESLSAPPVKQGRRSKIFLQQTSSGNLGVCLKREPASHRTLKIEYNHAASCAAAFGIL